MPQKTAEAIPFRLVQPGLTCGQPCLQQRRHGNGLLREHGFRSLHDRTCADSWSAIGSASLFPNPANRHVIPSRIQAYDRGGGRGFAVGLIDAAVVGAATFAPGAVVMEGHQGPDEGRTDATGVREA
jgi:hypothetical protein